MSVHHELRLDGELAQTLRAAHDELRALSRDLRRAAARLSQAPDAELRITAKAMRAFEGSLKRHRRRIATRAQFLRLQARDRRRPTSARHG